MNTESSWEKEFDEKFTNPAAREYLTGSDSDEIKIFIRDVEDRARQEERERIAREAKQLRLEHGVDETYNQYVRVSSFNAAIGHVLASLCPEHKPTDSHDLPS